MKPVALRISASACMTAEEMENSDNILSRRRLPRIYGGFASGSRPRKRPRTWRVRRPPLMIQRWARCGCLTAKPTADFKPQTPARACKVGRHDRPWGPSPHRSGKGKRDHARRGHVAEDARRPPPADATPHIVRSKKYIKPPTRRIRQRFRPTTEMTTPPDLRKV